MSTLKLKQGFTLIELLVVIAIIGILSAVVLTSLGTARARAQDARIQTEVAGSRASAELFFSGTGGGDYVGLCLDSSMTNAGALPANCASNESTWAFFHPLVTDTTRAWCADSTGASRRVVTPTSAQTSCPAAAAN